MSRVWIYNDSLKQQLKPRIGWICHKTKLFRTVRSQFNRNYAATHTNNWLWSLYCCCIFIANQHLLWLKYLSGSKLAKELKEAKRMSIPFMFWDCLFLSHSSFQINNSLFFISNDIYYLSVLFVEQTTRYRPTYNL